MYTIKIFKFQNNHQRMYKRKLIACVSRLPATNFTNIHYDSNFLISHCRFYIPHNQSHLFYSPETGVRL